MRMCPIVSLLKSPSAQAAAVKLASDLLAEGHVIAVPTDTIYGLASSAQNTLAIRKLCSIKGRDSSNPIAVCVGEVDEVSLWGQTDLLPKGLLKSLLPGPVTVVLNRTPLLNEELNPDTMEVGIRVPDHPFVRAIVKKAKIPLALTSANKSKGLSSLRPEEFRDFWPQLGAVFDGGCLGDENSSRAGSTVVVLTEEGKYFIKREGSAFFSTVDILHKFGLEPSENLKLKYSKVRL